MGKVLDIAEISRADDVVSAQEYLDAVENVDQLMNNSNGAKLTGAWIAAYFGARNVLALLVKNGADIEFYSTNATVRQIALINHNSLLGLIEGGVRPNREEIIVLFFSERTCEIPLSQNVAFMEALVRENGSDVISKKSKNIAGIIKSTAVSAYFPDYGNGIKKLNPLRCSEAARVRKLLQSSMKEVVSRRC